MAGALAPQPRALWRGQFGLAGRILAVDADDVAVAHMLQAAYAPALEPRPRVPDHSASLRRLNDGRLNVRLDRRTVPVAHTHQATVLLSAYYAAKEVFARFAAAHPGKIAFYGSLIAVDGEAILILGPTTIGKTILALHLALQGAKFLGDETAVLDLGSSTIYGLARKPALRESALPYLTPEMHAGVQSAEHVMETDRGRFWYALDSSELCGIAPAVEGYRLRAVCIVRDRSETFAMHRIALDDALPALMQRAYSRPSQLTEVAALRRSMRHVAHYELSLAEPERSAAALLEEVRACA